MYVYFVALYFLIAYGTGIAIWSWFCSWEQEPQLEDARFILLLSCAWPVLVVLLLVALLLAPFALILVRARDRYDRRVENIAHGENGKGGS